MLIMQKTSEVLKTSEVSRNKNPGSGEHEPGFTLQHLKYKGFKIKINYRLVTVMGNCF